MSIINRHGAGVGIFGFGDVSPAVTSS
jgi:hypothetical protein